MLDVIVAGFFVLAAVVGAILGIIAVRDTKRRGRRFLEMMEALDDLRQGRNNLVHSGDPAVLNSELWVEVAHDDYWTASKLLRLRRQHEAIRSNKRASVDWPKTWRLFSYILPKGIREKAFEPHFNELVEDFLEVRRYKTRWQRRWFAFAFTFRTGIMVLDCLRVAFFDHVCGWLPKSIRGNWPAR